ncbi:MAG: GMC oxidoreductase, partial [Phormidesmis sp.]
TAVLDLNCRTHDIDNLYVVDGGFFPSNSGVNPTLTIVANAIRVAKHLAERLGVQPSQPVAKVPIAAGMSSPQSPQS